MTRFRHTRSLLVAGYLALVALLSAAVWYTGFQQALEQVSARGKADIALAADRLVTQLARYRESAVLMAEHPRLQELHAGTPPDAANALLLELTDKTAALTSFYADAEGRILASAHGVTPDGLAEAPYFTRALHGALGVAQGSSVGFERRAYTIASPAFGPGGRVAGVLVVVVDIEKLEREWRGSNPAVLFTVNAGDVFITNRSEMLGWRHVPGGMRQEDGTLLQIRSTQLWGHALWRQNLSPYVPERALFLSKALPVVGMDVGALVDAAPAVRLALLQAAAVAALCLVFGAWAYVAAERRLSLAQENTELEARVRARTRELEGINAALRREVAERQEAEKALKRAQADLVQAGKLSALGQMSAGISHELNQPLMAIRSFAENSAAFIERGQTTRAAENMGRISDMARRMGRIIRNLRAFARQESEPMTRVDIGAVLQSVVELTETRLAHAGVTLQYAPPPVPVWVKGGEVRLGQVFVNLVSNAVDAMAQSDDKRIVIEIRQGARLEISVRDTGPGIEAPEKIFDPFYTTKSVGSSEDGMGLGLSISYGLVQSFGGEIRGANAAGGGAVFTVVLDRWPEEQVA